MKKIFAILAGFLAGGLMMSLSSTPQSAEAGLIN
jgi:hypothetical protein